jgi:hypothetical protein
MKPTPQQIEKIYEAFLSAFDRSALRRFLYFKMDGLELDQIAPNANWAEACYEIVRNAQKSGWLDKLIRAAMDNNPDNEDFKSLVLEFRLEGERNDSASESVAQGVPVDTSDPLLLIEDFKKDLEKIPADQTWNSEDYERELDSLRSWLPKLRRHIRDLKVKSADGLGQSVLCELRFADAIEDALRLTNDFELCLNCLIDSSRPRIISDQTRHVQWFRRMSEKISECLSGLQCQSNNSKLSREENAPSRDIDSALLEFIQRLRVLRSDDAIRLIERQQMLAEDSGIGACLNAATEYLKEGAVSTEGNIKLIRELLINVGDFIENTAQTQKRLPPAAEHERLFSQAEGSRLQKLCNEAVDKLDVYCRINHELISTWEKAALNGTAIRAGAQDLSRARRAFIESLYFLRRRFSELTQ